MKTEKELKAAKKAEKKEKRAEKKAEKMEKRTRIHRSIHKEKKHRFLHLFDCMDPDRSGGDCLQGDR